MFISHKILVLLNCDYIFAAAVVYYSEANAKAPFCERHFGIDVVFQWKVLYFD